MKRNHEPGGMMGGDEIKFYTKNGYKPGNAGETLEWAFQDWALSQMAIKLDKKKDAKILKVLIKIGKGKQGNMGIDNQKKYKKKCPPALLHAFGSLK